MVLSATYWIFGAIAALAACVASAEPILAQPVSVPVAIPQACETNDASVLRSCARSCFAVCRKRDIAIRDSPIGRVCNELIRQRSREDQAPCQAIIAATEKPRVPPPVAELIAAEKPPAPADVAKLISERCSAFIAEDTDDGTSQSGESPPPCLINSRHLRCRFETLASQFKELDAQFTPAVSRYRPLLKQVRPDSKAEDIEKLFCGISRQEMSVDLRKFEGFNGSVKVLTDYFQEQTQCVGSLETWINNYKAKSSTIDIGTIRKAVMDRFLERIKEALGTRSSIEGLIANVNDSKNVITDTRQLHGAFCEPSPH